MPARRPPLVERPGGVLAAGALVGLFLAVVGTVVVYRLLFMEPPPEGGLYGEERLTAAVAAALPTTVAWAVGLCSLMLRAQFLRWEVQQRKRTGETS